MLDRKNLVSLMKAAYEAGTSKGASTYSYNNVVMTQSELDETLRKELESLSGTYALFRENKNTIFSLMEEFLQDILPKKVLDQYGMFAEVKTFSQGQKPIFTKKTGKMRAKQFISKVGLAGIYEVFKLDTTSVEIPTDAVGGAAQIGYEEFLDGRVDFAEVTQIILDGLDELIYREMSKALVASIENLPTANKVSGAGFVESSMDRLIAVASAYGKPTIYCTYEFAVKIIPAEGWISDEMRNEKWTNGYLANYKGHRVIILPQSYEDETNAKKVIDPGYAWIIPDGGNSRPVKVAFEGDTIVDEYVNADRSRELQVYKKVGVGVMVTNNICVYEDTSLKGKLDTVV